MNFEFTSQGKPASAELPTQALLNKIEQAGKGEKPELLYDAGAYWKKIIKKLDDPSIDALGVESLSGNGFTTTAQIALGREGWTTAEYSFDDLKRSILATSNGQRLVIDESYALAKLLPEQLIELVEIIKSKQLKLILHVRLMPESHAILSLLRERGIRCESEIFEFAGRTGDLKEVAENALRQKFGSEAFIRSSMHNLANAIRHMCVTPGDVRIFVEGLDSDPMKLKDVSISLGLRDETQYDVLNAWYTEMHSPFRENRSPGKLGQNLYDLLKRSAQAENKILLLDQLTPEERKLKEKAERFNLANEAFDFSSGRPKEGFAAKDPASYI